MITIKDILTKLFLVIIFFLIMVIIMISDVFLNNLPYSIPLFFSPIFLYAIIYQKIKDRKKVSPYVIEEFKKKGYEIISERSLKFFESFSRGKIKIKPTILINNIPFERYTYITKFERVFNVKRLDGKTFEIYSSITKKWNGNIILEFLEKPRQK